MPLRHSELDDTGTGGRTNAAVFRETTDAANGTSTRYHMSAGDTFEGYLHRPGDRDWIAVTLEAGESYQIEMIGGHGGGGTLPDSYLRLHDARGNQIAYDDDGGIDFDSLLTFTASADGTYFINAGSYNDGYYGSYTILVDELPRSDSEPGSLDQLAGYLTDGFWEDWGLTSRRFDTEANNVITVDLTGLNSDGRQLARWAMEAWELVADLEFEEVYGRADIHFSDAGTDVVAQAISDVAYGEILGSNINITTGWLRSFGTSIDSYSYQTYMHEIGHALGLGHQGNYNGRATYGVDEEFRNDSWHLSVMSYFDQETNTSTDASFARLLTPMMADVIAIQNLYGAPDQAATAGDTTWGPGSNLPGVLGDLFNDQAHFTGDPIAFTIYDQGGIDTLDLSGFSSASRVDMRSAQFSDVGRLTGNVGIARGTVIENALAGSGDDTVTGNAAANSIDAGHGDDELRGNQGNDSLFGGSGDDDLFGGIGDDLLSGGNDFDRLFAGVGNDTLYGGNGNDRINGQEGNDLLAGGYGNDTIVGSSGNDRLLGKQGTDRMFGGTGNDSLYGGSDRDYLHGGSGDDTIYAGSGDDTVYGSGGDDCIMNLDGDDTASGGSGDDTIFGGAGDDVLLGRHGEDQLLGGDGDDRLFAGDQNDLLDGGRGRDILIGGAGDDTLRGAQGQDRMNGSAGSDTFIFGAGHGHDTINGFETGAGHDWLDFSEFSAVSSFADLRTYTYADDQILIYTSDYSSIQLSDFQLSDLTEDLFIF